MKTGIFIWSAGLGLSLIGLILTIVTQKEKEKEEHINWFDMPGWTVNLSTNDQHRVQAGLKEDGTILWRLGKKVGEK